LRVVFDGKKQTRLNETIKTETKEKDEKILIIKKLWRVNNYWWKRL
jgi:hypothetical protein